MSPRVLVSAPYMQPVIERYRDILDRHGIEVVLPPVRERLSETELLEIVGDVDAVISGDDQFTDRVLEAAPRLKGICKWGTGIDSIDRQECARRGIAVRNTPGAFSDPVADSVLGYALCFARRLVDQTRALQAGRWEKVPGVALGELALGVIGVGNVGRAVLRRSRGFGMRLFGNDIVQIPAVFVAEVGVRMVSLADLLANSDIVSVNCDLNPTSLHLIDATALAAMKPTAVLINTARGPIVDEKALIDALTRRALAGAALDVFEAEPLPADSPLRRLDSVMLAAHNANSSPAAWERTHRATLRALLEVLEGECTEPSL